MPFVGIGNILGGGSAISYAKKLAKAYEARVIADGGVVEALGCFTALAKDLNANRIPTLTQWQLITTQWQNITSTWN